MRLDLTLEYVPKPGSENASSGEGRGSLNERLSLLVESGKAARRLAGVRSDLGTQDLGGADRHDSEVARYCDDATRMASSASLALVLAA